MYVVDRDGLRLDVFISEQCGISRSRAKAAIESDGANVNGISRFKSGFELKIGDEVDFVPPPVRELDVKAENIPLEIVYQDEYMAVINKPQGMVVHPSESYTKGDTLVNALLYSMDNLSGINGVIRPGIVHRLDKDTSGLIVIAKNDEAHRSLAAQIEKKTARRIYIGLCDGNFKAQSGTVDAPIGRNKRDRKKMAIVEDGKRAVTNYSVIEGFGAYTLVRFELETGRTHQIRVHAASLHHPIVGDAVYGGSQKLYDGGQLLHACELTLRHPHTGEEMRFFAPLPEHFKDVLKKLRKQ